MSDQLMELEQTLETQLVLVKEMRQMKNEVGTMKEEIKRDVQELRDSITLNRHEVAQVQSMVGKKAWQLTDELFGKRNISDDLFLAKTGHFRSAIYKRLKDNFDVTRYLDIRRVDFKKAIQIISEVKLTNLESYQLRLTARHKEIAIINNDDIKEFL